MARGRKTGGRGKGTPNKATLEKQRIAAEIAEKTVMDARESGTKLGKDILTHYANLFFETSERYRTKMQGRKTGSKTGRKPNETKFLQYAALAIDCANKVANYQSPTFRAVAVSAPPAMPEPAPPPPQQGTAEIIDLKTDVRASHLSYMRMIGYGK